VQDGDELVRSAVGQLPRRYLLATPALHQRRRDLLEPQRPEGGHEPLVDNALVLGEGRRAHIPLVLGVPEPFLGRGLEQDPGRRDAELSRGDLRLSVGEIQLGLVSGLEAAPDLLAVDAEMDDPALAAPANV
jgi:hypothetical protein